MSGPLGRLWLLVLGSGIRSSAQADLDALAQAAEAATAAP